MEIVMTKYENCTKDLMSFIDASPSVFHAVENIAQILEQNGYVRILENDRTDLAPCQKYYITRNNSSIIAFRMPKTPAPFLITASHSDSPSFKVKWNCELDSSAYVKLNTEKYGGMILSSWLDRPLSLAGRVIIRNEDETGVSFTAKNVNIDRDLLIIPNVAPHQNRAVNDGFKYNPQTDMLPIFATGGSKGKLSRMVSDATGVDPDQIVGSDLFLYNRTKGTFLGADNEWYACSRIDNLACAYTTLMGLLDSDNTDMTAVYSVFDNEETGSSTKQGAASDFLYSVLCRICREFEKQSGNYVCVNELLASSFMVSADNGHAKHPNRPEFADPNNFPLMNKGVVIKFNAAQKYTTDAPSASIFIEICKRAGVAYQTFHNRSDAPGGSTLGSISNTKVPLSTVDIGLAQLAMHSSYETAGSHDVECMIRAITELYNSTIVSSADSNYKLLK